MASVVDSQGNVYQLATGPLTAPGVGTQAVYYASNIAAAGVGANAVTVTFTSAVDLFDVRVAEYQGVETSNVVDSGFVCENPDCEAFGDEVA